MHDGIDHIAEAAMKANIVNAFAREFDAYFTRLAKTVEVIRDEDWTTGPTPRETPVHQACHCLTPIAGYARLGIDCADIDIRFKARPRYPSRQRVLKMIGRIRRNVNRYIEKVADRTLEQKEWNVPPLFKLIYLLRHSIWHLCCMSEELHRRGYKLPPYSKRYRTTL
jgi:hypothetical protein